MQAMPSSGSFNPYPSSPAQNGYQQQQALPHGYFSRPPSGYSIPYSSAHNAYPQALPHMSYPQRPAAPQSPDQLAHESLSKYVKACACPGSEALLQGMVKDAQTRIDATAKACLGEVVSAVSESPQRTEFTANTLLKLNEAHSNHALIPMRHALQKYGLSSTISKYDGLCKGPDALLGETAQPVKVRKYRIKLTWLQHNPYIYQNPLIKAPSNAEEALWPLRNYVIACAVPHLTDEVRQEIIKSAQNISNALAKKCLEEAIEAVLQSPGTTKITATPTIAVNRERYREGLRTLELALKEYGFAPTFYTPGCVDIGGLDHDTFLGTMSPDKHGKFKYLKIDLVWSKNNPHIYQSPLVKVPTSTYSAKSHFQKEWQLTQTGKFTDVVFVQKAKAQNHSHSHSHSHSHASLDDSEQADEASGKSEKRETVRFHACSKKLSLHSPYFEALFRHKFEDSSEREIAIDEHLFESFKLLLEFIYLGELSSDKKLEFDELVNFLVCADFYEVETAKEWCVLPFQQAFIGYERKPNEAYREKLVAIVDEKNWQWLYNIASPYKQVREILVNCAKYNAKLLPLLKEATANEQGKEQGKSSQDSSSSAS